MIIDSHAHLDMEEFNEDLETVIERAVGGGVERIITIGIDLESTVKAIDIASRYSFIYATAGVHPHDADRATDEMLTELQNLAKNKRIVAWGEIGLDFFRNRSRREKQIEAFKTQLEIAYDLDLPVIIHNREADKETIEILKTHRNGIHKGVIHCFSSDYDTALTFIDMGFYISIPGVVTFTKADKLKDVAKRIPLDRMLVETDCPFLAPVPKRGKRNEPLYVTYTARVIADLRGISYEEVSEITTHNSKILYNID
jgi:TatD DNase family protein